MIHQTNIPTNQSVFDAIIDKLQHVNAEQIFYGISILQFKENDVKNLIAQIDVYNANLQQEMFYFETMEYGFLDKYATDYNDYFDTFNDRYKVFRKTINGGMLIFRKFCKRDYSKPPVLNGVYQQVFSYQRSILGQRVTQQILFKNDFPPMTQLLCSKILEFYGGIVGAVSRCRSLIREIDKIRKNSELCKMLYEQQCNEIINKLQLIINHIDETFAEANVDVMKDVDEDYCKYYHKVTNKELASHAILRYIQTTREGYMSPKEKELFGDIETTRKARIIVDNFDKLTPKGRYCKDIKNHKIDTEKMACFYLWLGVKSSVKDFHDWFFKRYNGKYGTITYSSLNSKISEYNIYDDKNKNYTSFCSELDSLYASLSEQGNIKTLSISQGYTQPLMII